MEYRAENHVTANRRFSRLDWPTPSSLVPAHRARAQALREMTRPLLRWIGKTVATARAADYRTRGAR